eukprot:5378277-Pyramimonas_sp.AAC.1
MLDKKGDLSDIETVSDPMKRFDASNHEKFSPFNTYGTAKLAATLLHTELARRAKADNPGVCMNVVSPGVGRDSIATLLIFIHVFLDEARALTANLRPK